MRRFLSRRFSSTATLGGSQQDLIILKFTEEAAKDPTTINRFVHLLNPEARRLLAIMSAAYEFQKNPDEQVLEADQDEDGRISQLEYHSWALRRNLEVRAGMTSKKDHLETPEEKKFRELVETAKEKTDAALLSQVQQPTQRQLRYVFIRGCVPMIGFGFLDNSMMLIFGDVIDLTIGAKLGLSTLAAAAIGNLLSDIMGHTLGGTLDAAASKLGLPNPDLTRTQLKLRKIKLLIYIAGTIGLVIGCILGMFPLFFLETDKGKRKKIFEQLDKKGVGSLGKDELLNAADKFGIITSEEDVRKFIAAFDTDKDGRITYREFTELIHQEEARATHEILEHFGQRPRA